MLRLLLAQELLEFMAPEEIRGLHGLFRVEMCRCLWCKGMSIHPAWRLAAAPAFIPLGGLS